MKIHAKSGNKLNPPTAHLKRGTHLENMHDAVKKRRHCFGSRRAGVSEEQVKQAVALAIQGDLTYAQIAAKTGCAKSMLRDLVAGKSWYYLISEVERIQIKEAALKRKLRCTACSNSKG